MGQELNRLPEHPSRPFNENPSSVVSLGQVKNFAQIRESSPFGVQQEFVLKMHDTNYDLIIVDVFHKRIPLSKRAVETLKYKKTGGRRLVLAHVDIGSAASYLFYWKPRWQEGSPLWISAAFPDDPDKYHVEYWRSEWQQIITGNTKSYIYGIIDQGFDGVVLDGMEGYRFFEGGGELEEANQYPGARLLGGSPRQARNGIDSTWSKKALDFALVDFLDDEAVLGREPLGDHLARLDFVKGDDVLNPNVGPEVIEIGMALVLFDQGAELPCCRWTLRKSGARCLADEAFSRPFRLMASPEVPLALPSRMTAGSLLRPKTIMGER